MRRTVMMLVMCAALATPVVASAIDPTTPPEAHRAPTPPAAYAQDVRPGDQVRFIARDQHIPAHPATGDSRVHLRFVSGSEATVLQVNSATG